MRERLEGVAVAIDDPEALSPGDLPREGRAVVVARQLAARLAVTPVQREATKARFSSVFSFFLYVLSVLYLCIPLSLFVYFLRSLFLCLLSLHFSIYFSVSFSISLFFIAFVFLILFLNFEVFKT